MCRGEHTGNRERNSLGWPGDLVRVARREHALQQLGGIVSLDDGAEPFPRVHHDAEVTISRVAVKEADRPTAARPSEQHVGYEEKGQCVENVQRARARQILLDHVVWKRPMLSPLDVNRRAARPGGRDAPPRAV